MTKTVQTALEPRKTPQQNRSIATVDAILGATVQVLLQRGSVGLTTVHVARRAGVSVGTLYQYFPNKQALLLAVLDRHIKLVTEAVEKVCASHHHEPLEVMVDGLVNRFIDAKLRDTSTAMALYQVASEPGGSKVIERARKRTQGAIKAMLDTARPPLRGDRNFMVHIIYLTMAGTLRGHLESSAPARMTPTLREHLAKLIFAYCRAI